MSCDECCRLEGVRLHLTIVEARNLMGRDRVGVTADPYVKVSWRGKKLKTEVQKRTATPQWNQTFVLPYGLGVADGDCCLDLQVKDYDMLKRSDTLGNVFLHLPGLSDGFYSDRWYKLDTPAGEIRIQLAIIDSEAASSAESPGTAGSGMAGSHMFATMHGCTPEMHRNMQATMALPPTEADDAEDDAICLTETPEEGQDAHARHHHHHRSTSKQIKPRGRVYVVRPTAPRYQVYGNLTPAGKLGPTNRLGGYAFAAQQQQPVYPLSSGRPAMYYPGGKVAVVPPVAIRISEPSSTSQPQRKQLGTQSYPPGTAQKIADMLEVMPQLRPAEALDALRENGFDKDQAIASLLDAQVDGASQTPEAKMLFQSAVDMFGAIGKTVNYAQFVETMSPEKFNEMTQTQQIKYQLMKANNVSMSPDDFIRNSGTRKALIIGINYVGSKEALRGCIDDAKRMKKLLTHVYGFPDTPEHVVLMTDDAENPYFRPTHQNMLKAMMWLTRDAQKGDVLFFHYSGHGSQKKSENAYEVDGMDETILPMDWRSTGHIIDDTLHQLLVETLPAGCKLTAVMDCCHSGTGMDLPFTWDLTKRKWETEYQPYLSECDVQMLTGCRSDQTSADVSAVNSSGGAMTFALLAALSTNPYGHTYPSLLERIHRALAAKGFAQKPQLHSTQQFTVNRPFSLTEIVPNTNEYVGRGGPRLKKRIPPVERRSRGIPGCDFD